MLRIVTDSAGDLPRELAQELNIVTVPIRVTLGGKSYRDGIDPVAQDFTPDTGYEPSTSQPSPWDFQEVFAHLTSRGDEVLCLTLSEALSGTYQSAVIAAEQIQGVKVLDTKLVSAGQGLLAVRAAAAAATQSLAELAAWVEMEKSRIRAFAALDSVEPIVRGGRTSLFARHAAGREGIKLLFTLNPAGGIQILERVRGRKPSLDRLSELLAEGDCSQVALVHVDCPREAAQVARQIEERCRTKVLYIQGAGGAVRTYAGRGAVIVAG